MLLASVAICVLTLFAAPLRAQSITAGSITGFARDETGAVLRGAQVSLTSVETGIVRRAQTSEEGRFAFELLPAGDYTVALEALGFRPLRIEAIALLPGHVVALAPVLATARPPVTQVTVLQGDAAAPPRRAGLTKRFPSFVMNRLPDGGRTLADLGRLSALTGREREVEGLPAQFGILAADGLPYSGPRHPWLSLPSLEAAALPLSAFERAELITGDTDIERSEFAGSILSGYSRRGTEHLTLRAFADWSGDALSSSQFYDDGFPSFANLRAALLVSGPVIRDTASFVVGAELQRVHSPFVAPLSARGGDAAIRDIANTKYGIDLTDFTKSGTQTANVISAFGRFDWQVGERHALGVRASFASVNSDNPDAAVAQTPSVGSSVEGLDASAAATLSSAFTSRVLQELRFGFERGRREWLPGTVPYSGFVDSARAFGTDPGLAGEFVNTTTRISDALHLAFNSHRVKVGLGATFNSFDQSSAWGRTREFFFSDAAAFDAGEGVFFETVGTLPNATFSTRQLAFFAQDAWTVAPGFELRTGVRFEREVLPSDRVTPNVEWADRTGLLNTPLITSRGKFSPRIAFRWGLGEAERWVLSAQAGVFHDGIDPSVFAELITQSGRVETRRAAGTVGAWPSAGGAGGVGARPQLTLLSPDFDARRTSRAGAGLARQFGSRGWIQVASTYRHTDFLTRREDLNRLPAPAWRDQYDRPVYGDLVHLGSIVAPDPATTRRFDEFDVVSALNADGYSNYVDLSFAFERAVGERWNITAMYTFSRTTDNWLSGRIGGPAAQLSPFPDRLDGSDWAEGRSDFDLPHRVAIGATFLPLGRPGLSLAGVYRYRSGYPFTPGFRDGVDVNGDLSGRNDVAFVDATVPGIDAVMREWDCLRSEIGRFAERNVCRESGVNSLDLRAALGPFHLGSYPTEIAIDLVNATDASAPVIDRALYLVDPAGQMTTDPITGRVTIPLLSNPGFGKPIMRRASGRMLRVGISVNY